MYTSEFCKHFDNLHGFTMEEARQKKAKVDEAHGVGSPNSKWNPAQIIKDTNRKDDYKVVISSK